MEFKNSVPFAEKNNKLLNRHSSSGTMPQAVRKGVPQQPARRGVQARPVQQIPRSIPGKSQEKPHSYLNIPLIVVILAVVIFLVWAMQTKEPTTPEPTPIPTVSTPEVTITPPPPVCGNGMAEGTELCDGLDFRSRTCVSEGFVGGMLACVNCQISTEGCTREDRGTLIVSSQPSAQIFVDGIASGTTPLTLTLEPGDYVITLQSQGYQSFEETVTLSQGKTVTLQPVLEEVSTSTKLIILSFPNGASVFINQTSYGQAPMNITTLPPGDYAVLFLAAGYKFRGQIVTLTPGETETVFAVLSRK